MSTWRICANSRVVLIVCVIYNFWTSGCVNELNFNGSPSADSYLTPKYSRSEEICQNKGQCDGRKSYPDSSCYCDFLCRVMDDCCENIDEIIPNDPAFLDLEKSQFVCDPDEILAHDMAIGNGVLKVSKCKSEWNDDETKALCERDVIVPAQSSDVILQIPVSDSISIMYRNVYCAYCNGVYDFEFWKPEYSCYKNVDVTNVTEVYDNCKVTLLPPREAVPKRSCPFALVSACTVGFEPQLEEQCTKGPFLAVYMSGDFFTIYRNQYCAFCNGINVTKLNCERDDYPIVSGRPGLPPPSLRMLVDLNTGSSYVNGVRKSHDTICEDNQLSLFDTCRDTLSIVCTPPAIARGGKCVQAIVEKLSTTRTCTWIKFEEHEYAIIDSQSVIIKDSLTTSEYKINGSDVFVCLDNNQTCRIHGCNGSEKTFHFDEAESLVSLLGLVISIVSLTITFVIYVMFRQELLSKTPGKIQLCLVISLWSAQLSFLTSAVVGNIPALCVVFAIFIHYFFLAAFSWMNVIAVDLWLTFSEEFRSSNSGKRLRMYQVYSWFVPLLIVGVAMVLDFSNVEISFSSLKPGYGDGICWISSRDALLLFFIGPLGLFQLANYVCFIFTAYYITRATRQGAMARQDNDKCFSLFINIKLSLVMGLTWVFAFIAIITNAIVIWYLFIIFNTLQGLFIALSFLCTRTVRRLLSARFVVVSSYLSSGIGTQLTEINAERTGTETDIPAERTGKQTDIQDEKNLVHVNC